MARGKTKVRREQSELSRTDVVEDALNILGRDAVPSEIKRYIKSKYRMDLDGNTISSYKTTLNRRAAAKNGSSSPAFPDDGPANSNAERKPRKRRRSVTNMEAVRRALNELGSEAKPLDIQEFIQNHYKVKMRRSAISNYKSLILKNAAKDSFLPTPEEGRFFPESEERGLMLVSATTTRTSSTISMADMRTMKELLERIGAEDAREMIDILVG